jgi:hypothetical protein
VINLPKRGKDPKLLQNMQSNKSPVRDGNINEESSGSNPNACSRENLLHVSQFSFHVRHGTTQHDTSMYRVYGPRAFQI